MDIRTLNTFIQAAEMRSFTKAGDALGYSQPTVSFQIRQLESELGVQLFERIGHTVKLTDAGHDALSYAQQICRMYQEMMLEENRRMEPTGKIRLAMADSLCEPLIIQELGAFRRKYPKVALKVTTAGTDELFRMLDHNEADLVCTLDTHIHDTSYVIAHEEEIGVHFVAPAGHPVCCADALCVDDLLAYPFLMTEKDMSYGRLLCRHLAQKNTDLHPVLEIGSPQMIAQLVAQGEGLSFLPDFVTEAGVRSGTLVRLDVQDFRLSLWKQLLYHRGKWMSLQLQAVIDHLSGIGIGRP